MGDTLDRWMNLALSSPKRQRGAEAPVTPELASHISPCGQKASGVTGITSSQCRGHGGIATKHKKNIGSQHLDAVEPNCFAPPVGHLSTRSTELAVAHRNASRFQQAPCIEPIADTQIVAG